MFLYVKLLLDSLIPRATVEDVEAEADNLPYGLDDMYVRKLICWACMSVHYLYLLRYPSYRRILSQISQSEQAQVKRILSWLVCARRPLKSVELEHAVMIRPGDKIFDRRRSLLRSIVDLCGPIVEFRGEYITLVHFSAKELVIPLYPLFYRIVTYTELDFLLRREKMDLTSPILKPRPTFTPLVYRTLDSNALMTRSVMKRSTNLLSLVTIYSMVMLNQTGFTIYVSVLEVQNTIWRINWRASCDISLRRGGINLSFLRKRIYSYRRSFALWNRQIKKLLKSCR